MSDVCQPKINLCNYKLTKTKRRYQVRIKELHEILQKNKNGKVTQNDIARAIGTSRANVSKLFAKNSYINDEKLKMIEEYFGINLNESKNELIVDYYPDSIIENKNGKIVLSGKKVKFKMPFALFNVDVNSKYVMTNVSDNSMSPNINKNDFIIIQLCESDDIINNKIYAFVYENNFYIRRLSRNINQIIVQSDNNSYPEQYIEKKDAEKLCIIGLVVHMIRTEM